MNFSSSHTYSKYWVAILFSLFMGAKVLAAPLDKSVQVDIAMSKITTLLQANKEKEALPYFEELESLDTPLPESFYFYYIDALDKSWNGEAVLSRAEVYLRKYGKKGKYYGKVISIVSRWSIRNAHKVRISDWRKIRPTYSEEPSMKLKLTDSVRFSMDEVKSLSHEDQWPSDSKKGSRSESIIGLVGYEVGSVTHDDAPPRDVVLIYIPKAENQKASFNVNKDFFVIIDRTGIAPF